MDSYSSLTGCCGPRAMYYMLFKLTRPSRATAACTMNRVSCFWKRKVHIKLKYCIDRFRMRLMRQMNIGIVVCWNLSA